jgi:tungstate transport system substrate-binding protein
MNRRIAIVTLAAALAAACRSGTSSERAAKSSGEITDVVLLTTTTTKDSGILDAIVHGFEASQPYKVKAIVAGSGDVLKQGATGEGDVLLTHSPTAEEEWMAKGNGTSRRLVMYNDFIVVGPPADPAGVKGMAPDKALSQIAQKQAPFVSRGDQSGTHVRELQLWKAATVDPRGKPWYRETGQGQGLTMDVASQTNAYALTDRGTFLVAQKRLELAILVEGDARLRNIYHVMTVDAKKFPRVNEAGGKAFAGYVVSPEGQKVIAEFGKDKFAQALFRPVAHMTDSELAVYQEK